MARRRAPEQAPPQGRAEDGGTLEDDDEAAAARVLRAPPAETDEDFEREFSELMNGGEPRVCRCSSACALVRSPPAEPSGPILHHAICMWSDNGLLIAETNGTKGLLDSG